MSNERKLTCIEDLTNVLQSTLAAALYLERTDIDLDSAFTDLGLDSVIGVEWTRAINTALGTKLVATKLYEYSTIRLLANFLLTRQQQNEGPACCSLEHMLRNVYEGMVSVPEAADFINRWYSSVILSRDRANL